MTYLIEDALVRRKQPSLPKLLFLMQRVNTTLCILHQKRMSENNSLLFSKIPVLGKHNYKELKKSYVLIIVWLHH